MGWRGCTTQSQMGNHTEFTFAVQWLSDRPNLFDKDVRVNVFEVCEVPACSPLSPIPARTTSACQSCDWLGRL